MSQSREKTKSFTATRIGIMKAICKFGFERLSTKAQSRYYLDQEGQTVVYFSHPDSPAIGGMLRYSNDIQMGIKFFLGITYGKREVIPMLEVKLNDIGQVKDLPGQLATVSSVNSRINDATQMLYNMIETLQAKKSSPKIAADIFNAADSALNTGQTRQISRLVPVVAGNALHQIATVYAHYTVDHMGMKENGREWSMKRNGRFAPCTEIRKIEKLSLTVAGYLLGA